MRMTASVCHTPRCLIHPSGLVATAVMIQGEDPSQRSPPKNQSIVDGREADPVKGLHTRAIGNQEAAVSLFRCRVMLTWWCMIHVNACLAWCTLTYIHVNAARGVAWLDCHYSCKSLLRIFVHLWYRTMLYDVLIGLYFLLCSYCLLLCMIHIRNPCTQPPKSSGYTLAIQESDPRGQPALGW